MIKRAYRYRFYPTEKQLSFFAKTFGCCRFVYNYFLALKQEHYKEHKKGLSYSECAQSLAVLKETLPWLKEVSSVPLQQALRHLQSAFERFFKKQARFPNFKKRYYEQSSSFMKNAFTFKDGELYLAKCDEPLNIRWSRKFQGAPSSLTISRDSRDRYYISFFVEELVLPLPVTDQIVGLDLGLTNMLTTSEGIKKKPGLFLKTELKRLRRRQKALSRKKKKSANFHKARKALSRLSGKIKDKRTDYLHKISQTLVNENQVICVEDLTVKNMMKNRKLARGIADAGWGTLLRFLEYKSTWYGRQFVKIDRFFPSSKQCWNCKELYKELTLSDRVWRCPHCDCRHDRDVTAAINIRDEGLRLINWSTVGRTGSKACRANVRPSWPSSGQFAEKQELGLQGLRIPLL